MNHSAEIVIREAAASDREAIARVLLEAYSEYAAVLPGPFWAEYRDSILGSVHGDAPVSRIVAEPGRTNCRERAAVHLLRGCLWQAGAGYPYTDHPSAGCISGGPGTRGGQTSDP